MLRVKGIIWKIAVPLARWLHRRKTARGSAYFHRQAASKGAVAWRSQHGDKTIILLCSQTQPSLSIHSPSCVSAPRQLLHICLISLPIWQWIMNGMLLLFAAGCCCCCSCFPLLLRDFIRTRQNALLFLGFSSDMVGEGTSILDPEAYQELITALPGPAMVTVDSIRRVDPFIHSPSDAGEFETVYTLVLTTSRPIPAGQSVQLYRAICAWGPRRQRMRWKRCKMHWSLYHMAFIWGSCPCLQRICVACSSILNTIMPNQAYVGQEFPGSFFSWDFIGSYIHII